MRLLYLPFLLSLLDAFFPVGLFPSQTEASPGADDTLYGVNEKLAPELRLGETEGFCLLAHHT
ncbi:MAG: hypothetical protein JSV10_05360 [Candidatus Zixiibacteriota bacterium]|nr:MAG: hypothetical protein JSV10_05360 [candidate division Zixibacteria bacterium]